MPDSETTILARNARHGDADSFGALVEKFQGPIFYLILGKVRDYEAARDLAQETFIQAYQGLHRLSAEDRFASWLYGIARNVANNHLRRKRDFVSLDEPFEGLEDC